MIELIDAIYKRLLKENVHTGVVRLIFRQVFYTVNCKLANTLFVRRDYCHVFKGMQIRQNLTMVEVRRNTAIACNAVVVRVATRTALHCTVLCCTVPCCAVVSSPCVSP